MSAGVGSSRAQDGDGKVNDVRGANGGAMVDGGGTANGNGTMNGDDAVDGVDAPPYTEGEKHWLKKHYESEFKFLLCYGLKIHDEEDREEGRRILRAIMERDD